jgi:hypothetical protein
MRPKTIRAIESIHSKGVYGPCSCGGEVLYYTDRGVRCSTCGKLYGVWKQRQSALLKRAKGLLQASNGAAEYHPRSDPLNSSIDEYVAAVQKEEDPYQMIEQAIDDV